jgi:regulator of protease activity HflC (stomatin/prohibitin superfamily)
MKSTVVLSALAILMSGCSVVTTEANHESVLVDRPYIFGKGGVRGDTLKTGREFTWLSTMTEQVNMNPYTVNEPFDDLTTKEGSYVDFHTTLTLQATDAVGVYKLGGADAMYKNNLQSPYREILRRAVREYSLDGLRTDAKVQVDIDKRVDDEIRGLIKELGLPAKLISVNLGKASVNKEVQEEINRSSAENQRRKTMVERKAAEDSRKDAEVSRAAADNAYRNALGLDSTMFIELERIKRFAEACSAPGNVCNVFNGVNVPVVTK